MKAAVYTRYGPPDVIEIIDVEQPVPNDDEVLIRVRAASVNALDGAAMKGRPYLARLFYGLRTPKDTRPGVDVAGQIEAVGRNVTQFKPGDDVFGVCVSDARASGVNAWVHHQGAFAEYVCAPASTVVLKPDGVTFAEAASVPLAGLTALQGLRDKGRIRPGQRVLINGAAGGVGTFAVQIAKSLGAEVTGVCSTGNLDLVRSIGADRVIDYTREDFTTGRQPYDVIFDCVGNHSFARCRRVLSPTGIYVVVGDLTGRGVIGVLARVITALALSRFVRETLVMFLARPTKEDLTILRDLVKDGTVRPIIDRRYSLREVPEAFRYLERRHARGKVVISVSSPDAR